jgi:hypothetical protein
MSRPNGAGLLPLHVAAASVNAPLDVLYYLARSRPESIYCCYANGGQQGVVGGGGSTSKGLCKRRKSDSPCALPAASPRTGAGRCDRRLTESESALAFE